MLPVFFIILSFASLLFILAVDLFFSRLERPVYMTNQSHVNLFVVPLFFSFIFFYLGLADSKIAFVDLFILILFTGVYIFILKYDKIILIGADMTEVLEMLQRYLKESGRNFHIYNTQKDIYSVEINSYPSALTLRSTGQWVEIDNHLHYDEAFVNELNEYFRGNVKNMTSIKRLPKITFYILVLLVVGLCILFSLYFI